MGKDFLLSFKKIFLLVPVFLMFLYITWGFISLNYSINFSESLLSVFERYTLLISFINMIFIIKNIKKFKEFLFYCISFFLIINLFSVLNSYLGDIIAYGKPNFRSLTYRGISGSINIMAYILIIQIFLLNFYLIGSKLKRTLFILFINSVSIFSIFGIFQTRSAILTFIFLSLVTYIILVYLKLFKKLQIKETLSRLSIKCFLPLIFGILMTNYVSNKFDIINIQDRLATVSNYSEDTSLSQRLRYYKAAFESFKKYPIHGIGIGGWEIESVKYENPFMKDYVVPYHAHNDYLETIAETGLIGFFLFYGSIFYLFFLTIQNIFFKDKSENKIFLFFVLVAFTSYLIDSLFNFPYDRTFQQIYLFFLLSIVVNFVQSPIAKFNLFKVDKILILSLIILFPASLYSSIRFFNASKDHAAILVQFNRNDFSKPALEDIESFEMTYPNITSTSLSMYSLKGLFYMRNGYLRDAIKYFRKGIKSSPHMYLSEYGMAVSYLRLEMPDSALYYSRKAFKSVPNNYNYFATYAVSLMNSKDSVEIKSAYNTVLDEFKTDLHDYVYLEAMRGISSNSNDFALSDFEIDYTSGNDQLKQSYYSMKIGNDEMMEADKLYQIGLDQFEKGDFRRAADNFLKASQINEYELPYLENAANSYSKAGNNSLALELFNTLIDEKKYKSPKAHLLRGIVLYEMEEISRACKDLLIAKDAGLMGSTNYYNILCLN